MNIFDEVPAKRRMPEDAERRAWARIKEGMDTGEEQTARGRLPAKWRIAVMAVAAAAAIAAAFLIIQPWAGVGGPPLSAPGPTARSRALARCRRRALPASQTKRSC
ncbi:hypothetical protein AHiyo8_04040 [Arthrobacter sp. Hiyo8]|nr:hypothetical protein AHiyo8_04040 [Arthrobacter sp. Hiyo8]